jgi:hypothetical protein
MGFHGHSNALDIDLVISARAVRTLRVDMAGVAVTRCTANRCAEAPPNEAVSIADLSQSLPRPSYLACPRGYCAAADMPSPIFDMPRD